MSTSKQSCVKICKKSEGGYIYNLGVDIIVLL